MITKQSNIISKEEQQFTIEKAELLKALSNPVRLCIIKTLIEDEKCNVSYFQKCMGVSQSSISQHLTRMKNIGILSVERKGNESHYFIKNNEVKKIVETLYTGFKKKK